jgi:NitT/TauT family transport system permease protein
MAGVSLLNDFRTSLSENWKRVLIGVASVVGFILVWYLVALRLHTSGSSLTPFLPYPQEVVRTLLRSFTHRDSEFGLLMPSLIGNSLVRVIIGFVLAFAVALPLGLLMGAVRTIGDIGRPIVEMIRPIPPIAWSPIVMLAFLSFWGPISLVFIGAFFPILLNIIFGVKSVDPVLLDAARSLGARRRDLFTKVIIPSVVPFMMTGVKVGLGIAWMCIVAAELLPIKGSGLGNYLWTWADIGQFDKVYSAMIVIGILSMLTTGVAELIERRIYKWTGMK